MPEFPLIASQAHIAGVVGVQVVVGRNGEVESASVVKPLPFGLDAAALTAIRGWRFAAAPSRTTGVIAFRFEIIRSWPLTSNS